MLLTGKTGQMLVWDEFADSVFLHVDSTHPPWQIAETCRTSDIDTLPESLLQGSHS